MRDYKNFDRFITELYGDLYPQPPDAVHTQLAADVIMKWVTMLDPCRNVLDVGCGQAIAYETFKLLDVEYTGVTLGEDYVHAKKLTDRIYAQDFSFLLFEDQSFDLVFSRHSLEHSPFPLLTLMEWNRVARNWLCLILPTPAYWSWSGQNHYSMLSATQARFLLDRAGWHPVWEDMSDEREFRWMCQRGDRNFLNDAHVLYEGIDAAVT